MTSSSLASTAQAMLADDKGLLAIDESIATCNKRFAEHGIPQTVEARRAYRDLIITAPGLAESIGGVILFDETLKQRTKAGKPFAQVLRDMGIMVGIKVDTGAKPLAGHAGETVTEGLDGLRERLIEYHSLGARFAKWRAVIALNGGKPSRACIDANAHALARYAALCQEADIVPVVEAEVLMDGDHSLAASRAATEDVLRTVFDQLHFQNVALNSVILKPNMVLAGLGSTSQPNVSEVAEATLDCLKQVVPAAIAGIAFLSGGQSAEQASACLNAINVLAHSPAAHTPWPLAFSFARAIQQPALAIWHGELSNVINAQAALVLRALLDRLARRGAYDQAMPDTAA